MKSLTFWCEILTLRRFEETTHTQKYEKRIEEKQNDRDSFSRKI